jgi:hypothetical protein
MELAFPLFHRNTSSYRGLRSWTEGRLISTDTVLFFRFIAGIPLPTVDKGKAAIGERKSPRSKGAAVFKASTLGSNPRAMSGELPKQAQLLACGLTPDEVEELELACHSNESSPSSKSLSKLPHVNDFTQARS